LTVLVSAIDLQIKLFIAGQHQLVPREQSSNHIVTKQYHSAFGLKWEDYSNFAIRALKRENFGGGGPALKSGMKTQFLWCEKG